MKDKSDSYSISPVKKKDFEFLGNKDDNIHKREAQKWKDKGTLTSVE